MIFAGGFGLFECLAGNLVEKSRVGNFEDGFEGKSVRWLRMNRVHN